MKQLHFGIALGVLVGPLAQPVLAAQEQQLQTQQPLTEIVVTGSRLSRTGAEAPIPVTAIDAEEITLSAPANIGDYLAELPAFGIGENRLNDVGGFAPASLGSNRLNLRNLTTARTVVLVDGKRHVGTVAGDTAVDVGSIPTALIERVETSTGGASVSYGADAVAGVVNIILKKDFEGLRFDGRTGMTDHGDARTTNASVTAGGLFGEGRGSAVIDLSYSKEDGLAGKERGWLRRQTAHVNNPANTSANDGIPAQILADNVRLAFANQFGVLTGGVTGQQITFDADGTPRAFDPGIPGGTFNIGGDGYNVLDLQQIANPVERRLLFGRVDYQLNDTTNLFFEGKFYNVIASNISQPSLDVQTHYEGGGLFNVDPANPFLPVGDPFFDAFVAANGGSMRLARFHNDLGFREARSDRDTYRAVAGINGQLFERAWPYEVYVQYGKSTERRQVNTRDARRFRLASDAVVDTTGVTGVTPGSAVCRSTLAAAMSGTPVYDRDITECRPVNLFGYGLASQESLDYFGVDLLSTSSLEQVVTGAALNGDLFSLPAGAVSFAVGLEYREERSASRPDSRLIFSETFIGEELPVVGGYDVAEAFLEARVPLLRDLPFVESLAVEGGVRVSEYSTVGRTTSWRAGGDWSPMPGLRFRGMYANAVRAPNVGELYKPQQASTVGIATFGDPCDRARVTLGPDPQRRLANCTAELAALGLDPLTYSDPLDGISKPSLIGGNPDLNEETATSVTFGAVYSPSWLPALSLSVDYYKIELDDAIAQPLAQQIIQDCYDRFDSIDNIYCNLFDRSTEPATLGNLQNIQLTTLNLASIRTSGIDFEASYGFSLERFLPGHFRLRVMGSYLDSYDVKASITSGMDERAGESMYPDLRVNLQAVYEIDRFSFSYLLRYFSGTEFDVQDRTPWETRDPYGFGSQTISDVQARYRFGAFGIASSTDVYIGVNNLFGVEPPAGLRIGANASASPFYDPLGRFIYAGVSVSL